MMRGAAQDRPHVIKDVKGKRPAFFPTEGLDQAMSMIMVLANEIAVLHDRLDSQERVAKAHGINMAQEIEALVLDTEALEAREAWRQDFLERLFYLARKEANEAANAESEESYRSTIADIAVS